MIHRLIKGSSKGEVSMLEGRGPTGKLKESERVR